MSSVCSFRVWSTLQLYWQTNLMSNLDVLGGDITKQISSSSVWMCVFLLYILSYERTSLLVSKTLENLVFNRIMLYSVCVFFNINIIIVYILRMLIIMNHLTWNGIYVWVWGCNQAASSSSSLKYLNFLKFFFAVSIFFCLCVSFEVTLHFSWWKRFIFDNDCIFCVDPT